MAAARGRWAGNGVKVQGRGTAVMKRGFVKVETLAEVRRVTLTRKETLLEKFSRRSKRGQVATCRPPSGTVSGRNAGPLSHVSTLCLQFGSDLCSKVGTAKKGQEKPTRGGATSKGQVEADRRPSVDMEKARLAMNAAAQQRPNLAEPSPRALEVPLRPPSADPCQPQLSSQSPSRRRNPPPLPPAGVSKALHRRPALSSGGFLPPNLMNELNSVLTKSGRSTAARSPEEEEERRPLQ